MLVPRLIQGGASFAAPSAPVGPLAFWENAVADAASTPVKYTLIGTSITFGQGASDTAHSWAGLLQAELVSTYGAFFTQRNEGVSGANVADFLGSAAVTGIPSDTSLVVIEIGVNDCFDGISAATFQGSLEDLIDEVRVVVADASILLIADYLLDNITEAAWDAYLAVFETVATAKDCALLNIPEELALTLVGPLPFEAPGTSEVKQGYTLNAFNTEVDLAAGERLTATVTTAFSSAGLGLIADATFNATSPSGPGVGVKVFQRTEIDNTGFVLYAFPYSAGYTGEGTFTYIQEIARGDGVHPNDAGHAYYAGLVEAVLV